VRLITLTTDYGTRDHYVATLKGVVHSIAPKAQLVDVTHEIAPFEVGHAAFVLRQIWPYYPEGTIHVAVVDPGVGTSRRVLIARYSGQYLIAPDNGLVTFLHREMRTEAMHVVENRQYCLKTVATTFDGRDVLAPVAAHLANGVKLRDFGRTTDRVEILPLASRPEVTGRGLIGQVLYTDRFGNLVSNIGRAHLNALGLQKAAYLVFVNGEEVGPIRRAFAEVDVDQPLAYFGGGELLEIALNRGRAVDRFGSGQDVRIEVR
jgi:S-adenosylmethionine hydrolase